MLVAAWVARATHLALTFASAKHRSHSLLIRYGTRWSSTPLFASLSALSFVSTSTWERGAPSLLQRAASSALPWCDGIQISMSVNVSSNAVNSKAYILAWDDPPPTAACLPSLIVSTMTLQSDTKLLPGRAAIAAWSKAQPSAPPISRTHGGVAPYAAATTRSASPSLPQRPRRRAEQYGCGWPPPARFGKARPDVSVQHALPPAGLLPRAAVHDLRAA